MTRHKRTHDREGGENNFPLSGEDDEEYSGEDRLGSVEEASPTSEAGYAAGSLNSVISNSMAPMANSNSAASGMAQANTFNSLQTLSMPMTISQPQPMNASSLM